MIRYTLTFWPLKVADKTIYRIVLCKCPFLSKGPPPNFDSYVVCEVLHVTAHHAKFLCGDLKVHSLTKCDGFDEFQAPLHPAARFAHTGCCLVCSILCLQYEIHVLQATKTAKQWQRSFGLVCFLAGYSFLYCPAGLLCLEKEAQAKLQCESIQ